MHTHSFFPFIFHFHTVSYSYIELQQNTHTHTHTHTHKYTLKENSYTKTLLEIEISKVNSKQIETNERGNFPPSNIEKTSL